MQKQLVGLELATDCIQFYVFQQSLPTRTRHPYLYMRLFWYMPRYVVMSLSKQLFVSLSSNIFSPYTPLEQNELREPVESSDLM